MESVMFGHLNEKAIIMHQIKSVSIPTPCHQSWQQMAQNEDGRYCNHCSKTVVDFKSMTDAHLIAYLTTHHNICGRFSGPQLDRVNLQLKEYDAPPKTGLKKWLMTMALLGSTVAFKVSGQNTPDSVLKVKQSLSGSYSNNSASRKTAISNEHKRKIKGQVFDDSNSHLNGATIRVLGTDINLATDTDGRFKFRAPISAKEFTVSFVGFETRRINIDSLQNNMAVVKMAPLVLAMNEVVIINGYAMHRSRDILGGAVMVTIKKRCWLWRMYYKYIRTPIHQLFY